MRRDEKQRRKGLAGQEVNRRRAAADAVRRADRDLKFPLGRFLCRCRDILPARSGEPRGWIPPEWATRWLDASVVWIEPSQGEAKSAAYLNVWHGDCRFAIGSESLNRWQVIEDYDAYLVDFDPPGPDGLVFLLIDQSPASLAWMEECCDLQMVPSDAGTGEA